MIPVKYIMNRYGIIVLLILMMHIIILMLMGVNITLMLMDPLFMILVIVGKEGNGIIHQMR